MRKLFSIWLPFTIWLQLSDYLESNNLLYKEQYSFQRNKSTDGALARLIGAVLKTLQGSSGPVAVFDRYLTNHNYNFRHKTNFNYPKHKKEIRKSNPFYSGVKFYNKHPTRFKIMNVSAFKKGLYLLLIDETYYSVDEYSQETILYHDNTTSY